MIRDLDMTSASETHPFKALEDICYAAAYCAAAAVVLIVVRQWGLPALTWVTRRACAPKGCRTLRCLVPSEAEGHRQVGGRGGWSVWVGVWQTQPQTVLPAPMIAVEQRQAGGVLRGQRAGYGRRRKPHLRTGKA